MIRILFGLIIFVAFSCNPKVYREVVRTDKIDEDIILFNIGNISRAEIGELLIGIEKCEPLIVGIDILFLENKKSFDDSILTEALQKVSNDIIAYKFDSNEREERSIDRFRKFASEEGFINAEEKDGVLSHFTPVKEVGGKLHESFALKISKQWKPEVELNLTANKSIPLLFQRRLQQYYYFVREDLHDKEVCSLLKNKIILVGFLGPGDEDKHFTPIRSREEEIEGKPDTYGLVIIANEIRTILEN